MKKIIYLSIALVTLSLTSCRNQDDMVDFDVARTTNASRPSATKNNDNNRPNYGSFNSSASKDQQGDPAKPPQD